MLSAAAQMPLPSLLPITVACIAGWLMTQAGLGKKMLERRKREKWCPSCGRRRRDCGCNRPRR